MGNDIFSLFSGLGKFKTVLKLGEQAGNTYAVAKDRQALLATFGPVWTEEIVSLVKGGADYGEVIKLYQQKKTEQLKRENPPPLHGSARWSTWQELKQAKLLRDPAENKQTPDVYLSAFFNEDAQTRQREDNWLYWSGNEHLVTIAPSGSGKSQLTVIQNLLQYTGSCFVFDPKGELYEATSAWRDEIGDVYRIAPFEEETDAVNPLDMVKDYDDARTLVRIIFPEEADGNGAFFEREARAWLTAVVWFVGTQGEESGRTLRKVRSLTASTKEDLLQMAEDFAGMEQYPESVREAGRVVQGISSTGHSALLRSLNEKLEIWASDAITRATGRSDFKFEELKKRTVTVYLNVPIERLSAYAPFVRTMLMVALDAMPAVKQRPKTPVLFLIDEFLRLGSFTPFVEALTTHRDAGVRLWFFLQNISTLRQLYPDRWESFFSETDVTTFFGIKDHFTAKLISEILEDETLAISSLSMSTNTGGENSTSGTSESTQFIGRRLMRPNEVESFLGTVDTEKSPWPGARPAITLIGGKTRARTILVPWYFDATCRERFGRKGRWLIPSKFLQDVAERLRQECFKEEIPPLSDIGYQDYSMGRDGYIPHRDIGGLYDPERARVIIVAAYQLLELYLKEKTLSDQVPKGAIGEIVAHFYQLVVHELLHHAVAYRTGSSNLGHGQEFYDEACRAFQNSTLKMGWEGPVNDPEIMSGWPRGTVKMEGIYYLVELAREYAQQDD